MVETNMNQIIAGGADDKEVITDAAVYATAEVTGQNASGKPASSGEDAGHAMRYSVKDPKEQSGTIMYQCAGYDSLGEWDGPRRYSDFHCLHETISKRWPGVPIPSIPPKKAIGNKDMVFIQERRFYLEQFMRKLTRFKFVIEAPEF
jgi:hypothetical protein